MIYQTKKNHSFWPSLYWVQDKAVDEVLEVMRGCILALMETNKYKHLPRHVQVQQASGHIHDKYHKGYKWLYDFDAWFDIKPGHRYLIETRNSKLNENVFDFMGNSDSPFQRVKTESILLSTVQGVVCNRDTAGTMFGVAEQRILQSSAITYPHHYRKLKSHVEQAEVTQHG